MYSLGLASWRIVRADEERYRLLRKIYTDNKTYRGTRTHLLSKACQKSKAIPHRLRQQYASLSFQINKHDLHKSLTNILRHEIINVNMLVNMLVPHILPAISWKPLSAHNSQQTLINYITLRLNRHTLTLHLNHPDIIGQRQREIARREAGGTPKFQQRLLEPLPNQADGSNNSTVPRISNVCRRGSALCQISRANRSSSIFADVEFHLSVSASHKSLFLHMVCPVPETFKLKQVKWSLCGACQNTTLPLGECALTKKAT